jgi:hypothetical protein
MSPEGGINYPGRQSVISHSYKVYNCFITSNILYSAIIIYLINNKLSKLDQKSKLYLFSNLKQNLSMESYLSISNFEYRKLITKLRISEYSLLIEKGRHLNILREQRLCQIQIQVQNFIVTIIQINM